MPRLVTPLLFALTILLPQAAIAQSRASGGDNFTLLVTDSGTVWSFGNNSSGQLGLGDTNDRKSPTQVPGLSGVIAVAAGGFHSLALTSTGEVYAWGGNISGQVGDESNTDRWTPQLLDLSDVVAIAAGERHSLALTETGDLFAWGENGDGQLGTGNTTDSNVPVLILNGVSAIGAGYRHSLAVKTDATAWAWGKNAGGQLGNNVVSSSPTTTPVQMIGVSGAAAVYGGSEHSVILLSDGTLKATGQNGERQLGDGSTVTQRLTAVAVTGLTNIQAVALGSLHNLALDEDGQIWVWGDGSKGALGTGGWVAVNPPALLSAPTDVSYIGTAWEHSIAIDANGVVSTWGTNWSGELGDGTTMQRNVPDAISASGYSWRVATPTFSVAAGTYNTERTVIVAVDTASATIRYTLDGTDPTTSSSTIASGSSVNIDQSKTLKAKAWKTGMPDSAINSATYTLQALTPSITIPSGGPFASPQNVTMQTGTSDATIRYTVDGTNPTSSSPAYSSALSVNQTTTFKSATFKTGWSASGVQTGTITFNYGALDAPTVDPATGNYAGTVSVTMSSTQSGATIRYTTNGSTPTASSTAYNGAVQISQTTTVKAKAFHSSYSTSAETSRTYTMSAATPTLSVAAGSYAPGSVVTISSSEPTATLRMTIDGSDPTSTSPIVASGTSLILGNFTLKVKAFRSGVGDSAIASAAYTLTSALGPGAVTSGGAHNLLATPDGRLYGWGNNLNGQLGNEATTDRPTPTVINTITGVTALASGLAHTLALKADGQVYAFGSNGSGRLGNNSTDQSTRPVHVSTLSNVIAIAAGDTHSLALTSDGRVFSWGANTTGQLGLGDFGAGTERIVPTQITSLSNIVSIAAGDSQSFAVTSGGQAYAWGANGNSRLGDGSTDQRNSPVLLSLSNIVSIAAGQAHTLALTSGGRVYGFGANSNGQLGIAATATVPTPTLIPNLHVSAIAAGDNHSGVIRADGALVMFGNSSSGQVGSGSITATIATPTVITSISSATTLSLGDLHSVAVTSTGEVWAWGESADYRLGNSNSSQDKASPQSILTGLTLWAPAAPTINVASGTLGATTAVTLTSSTSGAAIRYTLNGSLPTAGDPVVPANGQIEISYSSLLRARAFVTGRQAAVAPARADYELQSAAPVINPGTGTYSSAQTVSITATGAPGEIRYTLDGSEPTMSSSLYSMPLGVSTGTTIKAKTFPSNGWAASSIASVTLTFNYGLLDPPTANPGGGVFAAAPQVALSSISGATIRYTLNGTAPTASSTLYTGPITIAVGGQTLKSIALHSDWTTSAIRSDTYTVDSTGPTIAAKRFPLPMGNWQLTPVTVSFVCSDNVGIATCTSPVTVSQEGAGQTVSGTAVDEVGRQTTTEEIVNVDFTAPQVTLTTPIDGDVTSNSSVTVSAALSDALSGLSVVKCNGVDTPVVDGAVTCTATLRPGRNSITVSARDVAGNSRSAGATITLAGTPSHLTLSPADRTMLVGEKATLSLRDNFGVAAPAATWDSSDPSVVSLSEDDPPVLTALASGTSTISAVRNGLTAVATLTVVAGESLPEGTTRWNVAPTPGGGFSWLEGPIYTNPLTGDDPDLFMVETNTTTWERRLRAMSSESGEVAWLATSPGVPLMGDMLGGVIAGIEPGNNYCVGPINEIQRCYIGLARVASAGTTAWRYDSPGLVDRPAQGPDGTIYVVEHLGDYLYEPNNTGNAYFPFPGEKTLVILDGETGEVTARVPLEGDEGREPVTVGPIVGSDGYGYILVAKGLQLTLRKVSREGLVSETLIVSGSCSSNCTGPVPYQLLPDGLGGLLITATWNMSSLTPSDFRVTRLDGAGGRTDTPMSASRIAMIGRGGFAYVGRAVMAVSTLTTLWSLPIEWSFLSATPGGGAIAENEAGDIAHFDGTGQLLRTILAVGLRNPVPGATGLIGSSGLATNTTLGLRKVEGMFEDATYFSVRFALRLYTAAEQYAFGNQHQTLAPPQENWPALPKSQHDAIYNALADLVNRLRFDTNLQNKARSEVFSKLGSEWTVENFVAYLQGIRPHFHDGTRSTFCYARLAGHSDAFLCNPLFGQDVQGEFQSDGTLAALTWRGHDPLHVFFDPYFIGLNAEGKNLGNEALIFHEALHGFTNLPDEDLLSRLGLSGQTCRVEQMIKTFVLPFAVPPIDEYVAWNCPR